MALGVLPPAPTLKDLKVLSSCLNVIYIPKDVKGKQN
jgi:hypothetical protein